MINYLKPKVIPTIIFLLALCTVFFLVYLKYYNEERQKVNTKVEIYESTCGTYAQDQIKIDSKNILADVADDNCKKDLGLSGKTSLNDGYGMIFIFDKTGNYGFWMKDMNFPLDIVWIDNNFKIIGIEKNLATSTYPESFGEKYFAQYVLEIPAGYTDRNNIKVGDKIIFKKNN